MKVTFRIEYRTQWGESLALIAGDRKFPMKWSEGHIWSVTIGRCSAALLSDYCYVVVRDGLIMRTEWEHHRSEPAEVIVDKWIDCPVAGCPFMRKHSAAIFDRRGFRGAGTAIPVFSLRSNDDFGIGDFLDLKYLVDWASETGQCIIQLLPINDTTRKGGWEDSYPYSPVSSFALNPMYIRLQEIGVAEDRAFKKSQRELNALAEIDYPAVFKAKMSYIRKAYASRGKKDTGSGEFRKFCRDNKYWLGEYCSFCSQRDGLEEDFYAWVQYHLDRQLSCVVAYAHSKGIYLKGDLPIGVSADSAEAGWHPEIFNLDSSAGAPPDYFSTDGQNWGFPTYNWDEMAGDDYAWWKARLRKMSEYFDAFRIDHILGFFRIWEIPVETPKGLEGHFNPALPYSRDEIEGLGLPLEGLFHADPRNPGMFQPLISPCRDSLSEDQRKVFDGLYYDFFYHRNDSLWRRNAERKLPELLGATGMLACGEDLGMVPDCVREVMDKMGILSLRMRGMDSDMPWKSLSVCATSCHDMYTLRMQCADDPSGKSCGDMLWEFLASPSMLAVFPLQDWLSIDENVRRKNRSEERINEPAISNYHWRYRLHFPLENMRNKEFEFLTAVVTTMIKDSGRNN